MITKSNQRAKIMLMANCARLVCGMTVMSVFAAVHPVRAERPFTTVDSVEIVVPADFQRSNGFVCSANRLYCAVVLRTGNISRGTREYSLLLYDMADLRSHFVSLGLARPAIVVARFASSVAGSINDRSSELIDHVEFSRDGRKVYFLGRGHQTGENGQVFEYRVDVGRLSQITRSSYSITNFSYSPISNKILYSARIPNEWRERDRHGYVVGSDSFDDVMNHDPNYRTHAAFFVASTRSRGERRIGVEEPYAAQALSGISISPSGRWATITHYVRRMPSTWRSYRFINDRYYSDPNNMPHEVDGYDEEPELFGGWFSGVQQTELVDLATLQIRPLVNAPAGPGEKITWASDEGSVFVENAYAPLNLCANDECNQARHSLAVSLSSGRVTVSPSGLVQTDQSAREPKGVDLVVREDWDTPPDLWVVDRSSGESHRLTDLNPGLRDTAMGRSEAFAWRSKDLGVSFSGELMRPIGYRQGQRYPVVLQLYGVTRERFQTTGPTVNGFAKRSLINRGIMVLTLGCMPYRRYSGDYDSQAELPTAVKCVESAIDELDRQGLIDRRRVGLIGFSHSGLHVMQSVAFSRYPIAAALISDSVAATPFNYAMVYGYGRPGMNYWVNAENGSPPLIGAPLSSVGTTLWMQRSPIFRLDHVITPMRFELNTGIPGYWDIFATLRHLQRPAEMVIFPYEGHSLAMPLTQFTSQQGSADWFAYWLNGDVRTRPIDRAPETEDSLRAQYRRWGEFRAQEERVIEAVARAGRSRDELPELPPIGAR